jgi:glycosyltransferase involved in cell wall biosynthesis
MADNPDEPVNIAILAAGAGEMYCGSCLRDHALARALLRGGQRVTLLPMYTPLRAEEGSGANGEVFYGGVNVYLQHASPLFRHTPRWIDWLFDRGALLKLAGSFGTETTPAKLGPLTLSILRGDEGPVAKELHRLIAFLKADVRPQIVSLPNLMFIGLARTLRQQLAGAAIVCELTGEDLFLERMVEPYRSAARGLIVERCADVSVFVATSAYYAAKMADYLNVERSRIAVVHPSVSQQFLSHEVAAPPPDRPPTVGYHARICPEKGYEQLIEAMELLRRMPGMEEARLIAAGYLGARDRAWFNRLMKQARASAPEGAVLYVGETSRLSKLGLFQAVDVVSVPSVYAESKGIYILEAMARGVPVVQPAHGSFPELIELTGGGVLTPPGDLPALANALAELLRDGDRRARLGRAGRDAIARGFTDDHMAAKMLDVYRDVLRGEPTVTAA